MPVREELEKLREMLQEARADYESALIGATAIARSAPSFPRRVQAELQVASLADKIQRIDALITNPEE